MVNILKATNAYKGERGSIFYCNAAKHAAPTELAEVS
jgi:hypothetical protein